MSILVIAMWLIKEHTHSDTDRRTGRQTDDSAHPAWLCPHPPVQSGVFAALVPTAV